MKGIFEAELGKKLIEMCRIGIKGEDKKFYMVGRRPITKWIIKFENGGNEITIARNNGIKKPVRIPKSEGRYKICEKRAVCR